MPFIENERRPGAMNGTHMEPGDRCYRQYQHFMYMWNASPRWTTIDDFSRRIWPDDEQRAAALALLVFMDQHGNAYEKKKKELNGDVK